MTTEKLHTGGFAAKNNRRSKALKIFRILNEQNEKEGRLSLLDIGTGNGEIAGFLSEFYDVVSVDVIDQRETTSRGFHFVQSSGEELPFQDRSFDRVVSNHVIEHLADADRHLSEIWRVLKEDGWAYLATPNRFWPWEVHYRVLLLHYLPVRIYNNLLKRLDRHYEDVFPLTWWALRRKMKKLFYVNPVSDRICKWPLQYHLQCNPFAAKFLSRIPLRLYRFCMFMNPTVVVLLKKRTRLFG